MSTIRIEKSCPYCGQQIMCEEDILRSKTIVRKAVVGNG